MRRTLLGILALAAAFALGTGASLAGTISVAWDPVDDPNLVGYRVYYGTVPGSYDQMEDVGNVTSTTLIGLDPCTRYYIAIKAYDSDNLESLNYSNEISGLPRPVVSASSPDSGEQGASLTLSITGESFVDGATVEFSGSGITVGTTSWVSCNELSVEIEIDTGAPTGARDITVVNPDTSYGTGVGLFTVTAISAPTVSSTSPAAGATNVAVTVHPTVTFSEPMAASTITANNVQLRDAAGSPVAQAASSPTLSGDGMTATITPANDLDYLSDYRIWVRGGASGVTDVAGQAMTSDWQQDPPFTTAEDQDTQGPQVVSTDPADGASGVSMNVQPSVTFDEPVDPASVTSSSVLLLDASGNPVAQAAGSPGLSGDRQTATITPAAPLDELATYRIRVLGGASGVKDDAGNPVEETWTQPNGFTIENLPPSTVTNARRTDVR